MSFYKKSELKRDRKKYAVDCQLAIENGEQIRVEQYHKAEVDINNIIKRNAGNLELIAKNSQLVGFNMDDIPTNDFQEMMNIMVKAKEAFASIPSKIRAHFDNDPAQYMDFVRNPENMQQLVDWGLAEPRPEPDNTPVQVQVVNAPQEQTE